MQTPTNGFKFFYQNPETNENDKKLENHFPRFKRVFAGAPEKVRASASRDQKAKIVAEQAVGPR